MTATDPLAQLRDIHLPDPASGWPPGPGWWLLGAAAILLTLAVVYWGLRRYRANAWRRQARSAMDNAFHEWREAGDTRAYLQAVNEILKRAALRQFPREQVARLNGAGWEAFLDAQWRNQEVEGFSRLQFSRLVYQPAPGDVDVQALHRLARQWIANARGATC